MSSRLAGPVKHFEIIRILFCQNTRNVCIFQVSLDFNTTLTILDTGANLGMLCGPGGGLGRGELPASRLAEKMKMFETHQVGNESPLTHTEQRGSQSVLHWLPSHAAFGWQLHFLREVN